MYLPFKEYLKEKESKGWKEGLGQVVREEAGGGDSRGAAWGGGRGEDSVTCGRGQGNKL